VKARLVAATAAGGATVPAMAITASAAVRLIVRVLTRESG
jgi:hypothetical protein